MEDLVALLERHGFVAASEEAAELEDFVGGDAAKLDAAVQRRLTGEPLAWIVGGVDFCGLRLRVDPGVYVPRWQTEELAARGRALLGPGDVALDLCTGCGAVAAVLATSGATVLASDVSEDAVRCARGNGVDARVGDLYAPFGDVAPGTVDVIAGVVPYVPTGELGLLQRDTFTFETALSYDGGEDGCAVLRRAVAGAGDLLRPGGVLLLELGGDEAERLRDDFARGGFVAIEVVRDEDGDVRGVEATLRG